MGSEWLNTLRNAKKTCMVQENLRKVHYELPDGKEMVEEYNMDTGVLSRRAWKIKTELGAEGLWDIEIGEPEPDFMKGDNILIKENASQPFVTRRITKKSLEWRIRNMPYPLETYSVIVDQEKKCLTVKTSNKKYFKYLPVPELERTNLLPNQNNIEIAHKYNTLIITYKKPQEVVDMEKAIFEEVKKLNARNVNDPNCNPS